jgi:DNA-cytosine methyltransferase
MNVLSLFDGISCGQVALKEVGFKIDNYFASEIDKFAIKVTQHKHPETIQLGDVTNWREWDLPPIDLIIGGSPCQGFSFAGKQLNFEDPRSKLFFDFVDIVNHFKPKYFLLENVVMKKDYQNIITDYLGVEPILINSNLVSAQNRRRLYWTNIPNVNQPEDREILLKNIIEDNVDESFNLKGKWLEWWEKNKDFQISKIYSAVNPEKAICMTARQYANWNGTFIQIPFDNQIIYRKLTPVECERLQTLPDNYTSVVSNSQRYRALGNGWTVAVIEHIFKNME